MTWRLQRSFIVLAVTCCPLSLPIAALAVDPSNVQNHAEQSFNQLDNTSFPSPGQLDNTPPRIAYPSEQFLIGQGHGDMAKGSIVCQRVSELSARTDLAKQIRILVKEHMVDRIRERTGRDADQDIEVTREEIVQEYLQGVKIIARHIDEEKRTCSATAVMPKSQIQSNPAPDYPGSTPVLTR